MVATPQIAPLAGMTPLGLKPAVERETLAGVVVDQGIIPGVQPVDHLAREIARKVALRDHKRAANLPAGGLFDSVERDQLDLFGGRA